MEKFIPYEKLSKVKKRELNAEKRRTWPINPVVRRSANSKAYNRKKAQRWKEDDSISVPLFCLFLIWQADTYPQQVDWLCRLISRTILSHSPILLPG